MNIVNQWAHSFQREEYEEREKALREKALSYLRAKYPSAEEEAFFTDYTGQIHPEVIQVFAVSQAAEIEEICVKCEGEICLMSEALKAKDSRPVVNVSRSPKGYSYLDVRWTYGFPCKYKRLRSEFRRMFMNSGIKATNADMTFGSYEFIRTSPETLRAKTAAIEASKAGTWLILAGKPGTGKTHLAVAIAIKAMEEGRPALFRLVSTMLDEIQTAIRDNGDYDGLMRQFKTVPCLVLDDLGHENLTVARASYLHQIIDYRYGEKLQTIVTTNARTPEELCRWSGEEYMLPIISRFSGSWVTIENAEDYRRRCNDR